MPRPWWNPWSDEPTESVDALLENILTHLRALEAQGKQVKMASDQIAAGIARIMAALANIAADIRRLKDAVQPGMTDEQVAAAQALIDSTADRAEAMAAENPDPTTPA